MLSNRLNRSRVLTLSFLATIAALVFVLHAFFLTPAAPAQQESPAAARVRGLNNHLLRIHGQMQQATPNEAAQLRNQAATVIEERAAALRALVKQSPKQALSLAFSPELLADLAAKFPQSTASLESHVRRKGPIEYFISDDATMTRHGSLIAMQAGSETLEVYFAESIPAGLTSGVVLEVQGVQAGNLLAAEGGATITSTTAQTCSTAGVQNTAVLLVTFPGVTPPVGVTPESVYATFFGTTGRSLDGFWREASYGQTSAAGNVFGWYTLSSPYTCSTMDQARDEAIAIATAAGANFQNYTRLFVIFPDIGCVAGFAQVGCSTLSSPSGSFTASTAYIEADYMTGDQAVQLATHEAGHNLGLLHSGTLGFGTEPLGPLGATGTVSEFGDYWSTMGSQTLGIYPAQQKAEVLNWLASGTNYLVVQSSGTWSLQPLEVSPPGLQALKIQRGTGNNGWLWVEYRQPIGNYDSTLMTQPFSGALIHYEDPTTGAYTHLLDFSPDGSWNTWWYPALLAGQTWTDPYTNLSISVQSAAPNALTVNATYGPMPCSLANPTVSAEPLNPSTTPGNSVSYNVSVTNNDSAGCPSSAFSLSSGEPSGWPTGFSATSLTLSPGQSGSVTMAKTAPAGTSAGTYPVDAKAADTVSVGAAAANITVTTAPALAVTVSTSSSLYTLRQTVSMTAKVLTGGNPAPRASVSFTLTQPDGTNVVKVVKADSTGEAIWNYRLSRTAPLGSYTVVATATYDSQMASSSTASFTVK